MESESDNLLSEGETQMKRNKWLGMFVAFVWCLVWGTAIVPFKDASAAGLPSVLNMGTLPTGSLLYATATSVSTVWSRQLPTQVKPMPTSGPLEWGPLLATKEVDLGIGPSGDMQGLWLARYGYENALNGRSAPIRLLSICFPIHIGIIVSAESNIKTGKDLKGKRFVGDYTGSPGQNRQAKALLADLGLTLKDVRVVSVPNVSAGVRAVTEGRADANGTSAAVMGVIRELDAAKGARFISLDPSPGAVKRAQAIWPGEIVKVKARQMKLKGTPNDVFLYSYDQYIVARESLDTDTAYALTKVLWDNNSEIRTMTPAALKLWTKDRYVRSTALIPYHEGAIKFYKEVGVWTPAMDALQKELLAERK